MLLLLVVIKWCLNNMMGNISSKIIIIIVNVWGDGEGIKEVRNEEKRWAQPKQEEMLWHFVNDHEIFRINQHNYWGVVYNKALLCWSMDA